MFLSSAVGHAQTTLNSEGAISIVGDGGTNAANSVLLLPDVPTPGVTIAVTNTNQLLITITNGVSYANYELYRRTLLDAAHPWTLPVVGVPGQTNFIVEMGVDQSYFQVGVGSDWDGDHVPNSKDADPLNPNALILQVWIDSPVQGDTLQ